ncbi:GNAT family N-acetyltransferase [Nakamurella sp. A5-74]|uniref:GNAT family N-acetyltransferase n=1 Tax=Nakamurella sp. A5-74 TaxID=3158264 RepID=A0AAU8DQ89_9ACTN
MLFLRPAVPADAARLAELHIQAWHETYTGLVSPDVIAGFDVDERRAMWTRALGQPTTQVDGVTVGTVVAEEDGQLVGFASVGPSRGEDAVRALELWSIYVLAQTYGTGVGPALLDAALGDAPAQVWLAADNARATAFYAKHGFVEDGVRSLYEVWNLPEKRMVR